MTDYLDMATKWLSGSVVKDIDGGHVDRALASLLEQVSRDARKAERERCARVCDKEAAEYVRMARTSTSDMEIMVRSSDLNAERALMYERAAAAIRALPTTEDEDANRS